MDGKLKQAMIETLKDTDTINNSFFKEGSIVIGDMTDHISLFDNNKELSKNAGKQFDTARNTIAADVALQLPAMFKNNEEFLTNFSNKKSRSTAPNQDLFTLIIQALNLDSRWKTLLHTTLPNLHTDQRSCHSRNLAQ